MYLPASMPGRARRLSIILIALLLAACSNSVPQLPPVTEEATRAWQPGHIVWHDLLSEDPAASEAFYTGLLGWSFRDAGADSQGYRLITHQGRLIGGLVDARQIDADGNQSQWLPVMSVQDVDSAVQRAVAKGARTLAPPTDLGQRGRMAVITDAHGAPLSLLRAANGDPPAARPRSGSFVWNELWTEDPNAAADFFTGLGNLSLHQVERADGRQYQVLQAAGKPAAGLMARPDPAIPSSWVSYIGVTDVTQAVARARQLGGRVVLAPRASAVGGQVAAIVDPAGAGFLLQTWPVPRAAERGVSP